MKKTIYIVSAFILACLAFSCEDKPSGYEFPEEEYFYDIPEVSVTENYVVGVSYDTKSRDTIYNVWWDAGATTTGPLLYTGNPELGEYDTKQDPDVMHQHLQWGKEAGIDFFILSWGGHGYNDTILAEWEKMWQADQALPKVVIRYDPGYRFPKATGDSLMEKDINGNYKPWMDSLRYDFDSLYQHVILHDFAYKKRDDNKPVMVLTNFTNSGHIISAYDFTNYLRSTVGNNIWIMGELQGRLTSPERWGYHAKNGYTGAVGDGYVNSDSIRSFDAFFITDVSTDMYERNMSLYSFTDYNYRYWSERMLPLNKEYVPTIMPSFDNTVNDANSGTYIIPRWNNQAYAVSSAKTGINFNFSNVKKNPYQEFANVAKRTADKNPSRIVIVYSWNNFVNGTSLEPTTEYGRDYLNYTKQFFKK
ncbi:MAG: glycoside hydrolase family 99-like domain-containing protein [Candidatus Symbiothrix sp.]|jgi:hypothetical protein|nr:glycoside hydrolase family 99-like domain-containing protein [Candidatus Symbiothrix sp.]